MEWFLTSAAFFFPNKICKVLTRPGRRGVGGVPADVAPTSVASGIFFLQSVAVFETFATHVRPGPRSCFPVPPSPSFSRRASASPGTFVFLFLPSVRPPCTLSSMFSKSHLRKSCGYLGFFSLSFFPFLFLFCGVFVLEALLPPFTPTVLFPSFLHAISFPQPPPLPPLPTHLLACLISKPVCVSFPCCCSVSIPGSTAVVFLLVSFSFWRGGTQVRAVPECVEITVDYVPC